MQRQQLLNCSNVQRIAPPAFKVQMARQALRPHQHPSFTLTGCWRDDFFLWSCPAGNGAPLGAHKLAPQQEKEDLTLQGSRRVSERCLPTAGSLEGHWAARVPSERSAGCWSGSTAVALATGARLDARVVPAVRLMHRRLVVPASTPDRSRSSTQTSRTTRTGRDDRGTSGRPHCRLG